jgi:hypothetical protein
VGGPHDNSYIGASWVYARRREKVLGPEHPDTAQSRTQLAWLLRDQGDLAGAQALCERALTIPPRCETTEFADGSTNAIERLHEEFKRRIKTQTVLPSADTAAMLFWALLASGQINMRKVDGWQGLPQSPSISPLNSPHNMP